MSEKLTARHEQRVIAKKWWKIDRSNEIIAKYRKSIVISK